MTSVTTRETLVMPKSAWVVNSEPATTHMNMNLVLWRHAVALDRGLGCADMQRRITPRGEKQVARMAAWLDRRRLQKGARIWVRPARRTEQTAQALGRKYMVRRELAPGASAPQ
jgi:phosphohistidine phosphatase